MICLMKFNEFYEYVFNNNNNGRGRAPFIKYI